MGLLNFYNLYFNEQTQSDRYPNNIIAVCLSAFFILSSYTLYAQQELSLPHLWHLGQQNSINPAAHHDSTYYINIPDLAAQFGYSEPNIREVLSSSGNVEVVDITDDMILQIKWLGNCESCSMSAMTMRAGIEQTVKGLVPEIASVEAINGMEI